MILTWDDSANHFRYTGRTTVEEPKEMRRIAIVELRPRSVMMTKTHQAFRSCFFPSIHTKKKLIPSQWTRAWSSKIFKPNNARQILQVGKVSRLEQNHPALSDHRNRRLHTPSKTPSMASPAHKRVKPTTRQCVIKEITIWECPIHGWNIKEALESGNTWTHVDCKQKDQSHRFQTNTAAPTDRKEKMADGFHYRTIRQFWSWFR